MEYAKEQAKQGIDCHLSIHKVDIGLFPDDCHFLTKENGKSFYSKWFNGVEGDIGWSVSFHSEDL